MRFLYLFILICLLEACSDDDHTFDITMPVENVRFEPRPGGAMMYYHFPKSEEIFSINARYTDCRGDEVLKSTGYGADSLMLDGFNEKQKEIPVQLTLVNRSGVESEPTVATFNTNESVPYAFFNKVVVEPSWDGFQVSYPVTNFATGKFHVFYLGTNPVTEKEDTLLETTRSIIAKGDTLMFPLKNERTHNTIVIRTEDTKSFRVRQEVWENVEAYHSKKLDLTPENLICDKKLIVNSEKDKCGVEYLFDGDLKGERRATAGVPNECYTFLAGPNAINAPFIIDMQEARIPASIRIYGMLRNTSLPFPLRYGSSASETGVIWNGSCEYVLPCSAIVYGGNSNDPNGSWIKLGAYSEVPTTASKERWCARCFWVTETDYTSVKELKDADPAYFRIIFPASKNRYRYLKVIFNNRYAGSTHGGDQNPGEYINIHELEVYIKEE